MKIFIQSSPNLLRIVKILHTYAGMPLDEAVAFVRNNQGGFYFPKDLIQTEIDTLVKACESVNVKYNVITEEESFNTHPYEAEYEKALAWKQSLLPQHRRYVEILSGRATA